MSLYRGDETSGTGTSVEDLISGKVNRTGDTMTGALNVPAGATGTQVPQRGEIDIALATKAELAGSASQAFSVAPATSSTHALQASQNAKLPVNLNGNFQIAQAGTSFAAPATGAYDLDGWLQTQNTAVVYTVTQGTGSAANKLARITTITTADASVAAGDIVREQTRIEGYDIVQLVGQTFTVSFNAKFPVTGIHCVYLLNSGSDRSYVHEVNCTAANTWASYSFTVTGGLPSTGTWSYTTGIGLYLIVVHMAGSTYTGTPATADTWMTGGYVTTANQVNDCATIGNVWALEDVRIDLGSVPGTDWPSYQENLARCQRYYLRMGNDANNSMQMAGYQAAGVNAIQYVKFSQTMRATPTATKNGAWNVVNCSQPGSAGVGTDGFSLYTTVTALGVYSFNNSTASTMYFEFASRL